MTVKENNKLFPVFLKLEQLSVLIVGGGTVALEKLTALLQNSPAVAIRLVAVNISDPVRNLAAHHPNIELVEGYYRPEHLRYMNVVVVAVNDSDTSEAICKEAREAKLLVNVADKPELCDFYMSSIVKKGNLKIAISTNGKSPTIAKRLKETLNDALPDQLDDILGNMETECGRIEWAVGLAWILVVQPRVRSRPEIYSNFDWGNPDRQRRLEGVIEENRGIETRCVADVRRDS